MIRTAVTFAHPFYRPGYIPGLNMPDMLMDAMVGLRQDGLMGDDEVLVDFYCPNHDFLGDWLQDNYPQLSAMYEGPSSGKPGREPKGCKGRPNVLYASIWFGPGHEGVTTSKFFEYLSTRRQVVGVFGWAGGAIGNLHPRPARPWKCTTWKTVSRNCRGCLEMCPKRQAHHVSPGALGKSIGLFLPRPEQDAGRRVDGRPRKKRIRARGNALGRPWDAIL